jgi:ABC-type antimicrobial peptide transport system permease subunit
MAGGLCAALAAAMRGAPGFVSVVKGLSLTPLMAALTLLIALLIGVASSLVPALSAARTSILDALRFTG